MSRSYPCARQDDLLVQNVLDETLVYDQRTHQAHSLNANITRIWKACDGKTSLNELQGLLTDQPEKELVVEHILQELDKHQLLVADSLQTPHDPSRRAMLAKAGMVAVALPFISSIAAPTAAQAQSGQTGITGPTGATGPTG